MARSAETLFFSDKIMEAGTCVYLKTDRYSAMADFIIRRAGSLEVRDYDVPQAKFLPDTMPRHPRSHDAYYTDGGTHAPDRYIVSVNGAAD